jgi:hypothetical protein
MHALSDTEKANKQMAILQPLIAHHLRSPFNNPCTSSYFVVSRIRPGKPWVGCSNQHLLNSPDSVYFGFLLGRGFVLLAKVRQRIFAMRQLPIGVVNF